MNILLTIVNYNGKKLLQKNIPFLLKYKGENTDICVVDNNSIDDSVSFLEQEYPNIKIVISKENVGYGRAHNLGFKQYPEYDYYVFLNNDIRVTENWLDSMLSIVSTQKDVGVVGPKILLSQKKEGKYVINSAGMYINTHLLAYDRYEEEYDDEKYSITETVDAVCGAVMLIPRGVIRSVGGFNEKMHLYYEDVDLCLRIKDEGYKIYYCGESTVYHDHMASTKSLGSFKRNWMSMKNRFISIRHRLGLSVAIKETIWYLYSWIVWKIFYSKKITLKEYINDK